jgi:hypothetical protein
MWNPIIHAENRMNELWKRTFFRATVGKNVVWNRMNTWVPLLMWVSQESHTRGAFLLRSTSCRLQYTAMALLEKKLSLHFPSRK